MAVGTSTSWLESENTTTVTNAHAHRRRAVAGATLRELSRRRVELLLDLGDPIPWELAAWPIAIAPWQRAKLQLVLVDDVVGQNAHPHQLLHDGVEATGVHVHAALALLRAERLSEPRGVQRAEREQSAAWKLSSSNSAQLASVCRSAPTVVVALQARRTTSPRLPARSVSMFLPFNYSVQPTLPKFIWALLLYPGT
eukprot:SAG11_NODE_4992_length_1699_cov_1.660000_2_plen_197_part_00